MSLAAQNGFRACASLTSTPTQAPKEAEIALPFSQQPTAVRRTFFI